MEERKLDWLWIKAMSWTFHFLYVYIQSKDKMQALPDDNDVYLYRRGVHGNTRCKLEALKLDEEGKEILAVKKLHPHLEKSRKLKQA